MLRSADGPVLHQGIQRLLLPPEQFPVLFRIAQLLPPDAFRIVLHSISSKRFRIVAQHFEMIKRGFILSFLVERIGRNMLHAVICCAMMNKNDGFLRPK